MRKPPEHFGPHTGESKVASMDAEVKRALRASTTLSYSEEGTCRVGKGLGPGFPACLATELDLGYYFHATISLFYLSDP